MKAFYSFIFVAILVQSIEDSVFSQIIPPEDPTLISVKVDTASGDVIINWLPSPSTDVIGYIIYRDSVGSTGFVAVDTVPSTGSATYTYNYYTSLVTQRSVIYSVVAYDSEGTASTPVQKHNTIFLTLDYDSCEQRMYLDWNSYVAWTGDNSLTGYNVYLDTNNRGYERTPYEQIQDGESVPTQGYLENVAENTNYCIFVEAVHQDGIRKSTSNAVCYYTEMPRHPSWVNADYATVTDEGLVKLSFSRDPAGETGDFVVIRGKNDTASISYSLDTLKDVTDNPLLYYDTIVYDTVNYYYMLLALDACDAVVSASNVAGNITLKAKRPGTDPYTINLSWSRYLEWDLDVHEYYIYRILNDTTATLRDSVPNLLSINTFTYSDDVENLVNQGVSAQIAYYILARENDGNPYYPRAESRSNLAVIDITPQVYMPDAFTPNDDAFNETIKPIITFEPKEYRFSIYDRWGTRVFETENSMEAWDGTLPNGSRAVEGVYVYYLKLTTRGDIIVEKRGTLILIYP